MTRSQGRIAVGTAVASTVAAGDGESGAEACAEADGDADDTADDAVTEDWLAAGAVGVSVPLAVVHAATPATQMTTSARFARSATHVDLVIASFLP